MIQNDIHRASIDVQSILEKIQKEIETGNPSSDVYVIEHMHNRDQNNTPVTREQVLNIVGQYRR